MECASFLSGAGKEHFPGFIYAPNELQRFHEAAGIFTLLLSDDRIIHFEPEEPCLFRSWLYSYGVAAVEVTMGPEAF